MDKMAVFDIDDTVVYWDDGVANRPIPKGIEKLNELKSKDYIIAYCTAKPENERAKTLEVLKSLNLPHEDELLFMIKEAGMNVPRFKRDTVKRLMEKFDVQHFYDDKKINRSVVSNLGVPIVEAIPLEEDYEYQEYIAAGEEDTVRNPKPISIRIEESSNPGNKMMATFEYKDGKTKTTHFGARGMSDYTQHKDEKRMKLYLKRHGGVSKTKSSKEYWDDPTTAGALSRWILWGKPSLRESFNDFKKRFNLKGTMTVTNTAEIRRNARGTMKVVQHKPRPDWWNWFPENRSGVSMMRATAKRRRLLERRKNGPSPDTALI